MTWWKIFNLSASDLQTGFPLKMHHASLGISHYVKHSTMCLLSYRILIFYFADAWKSLYRGRGCTHCSVISINNGLGWLFNTKNIFCETTANSTVDWQYCKEIHPWWTNSITKPHNIASKLRQITQPSLAIRKKLDIRILFGVKY